MFEKILVANRGEIAVRVIRACRELDIRTVAIYSEPDANSMHVQMADEAICIGPGPSRESYLRVDRVIGAAEMQLADGVDPGAAIFQTVSPTRDLAVVRKGVVPQTQFVHKTPGGQRSPGWNTDRAVGVGTGEPGAGRSHSIEIGRPYQRVTVTTRGIAVVLVGEDEK